MPRLSTAILFCVSMVAVASCAGQLGGTSKVSTSALPPVPSGRSTVIGGEIREVDPVRDEFVLKVFGGRPVRVFFDERTLLFHDGAKTSVLKLKPEDHASIETTLDGDKVFAIKIHLLSQLPQGDLRGQVANFDPQTKTLTVKATAAETSIVLHVPPGTPILRNGRSGPAAESSADLPRGSLIDVKFNGGTKGSGVAKEVDILVVPGSVAVFTGSIASLDLRAGRLVIVDSQDTQSHEVAFDPTRVPASRSLHEGSAVKVTTTFDGSRYVASEITPN